MERENRELRRAKDILRMASAFFAQAVRQVAVLDVDSSRPPRSPVRSSG
ncbi:hypothetical protein ODI_R0336 [Orrella dioscoreae]|uniref:Mobile element protein n=1 Tax=Orrella dioscoreae TaxID=1851544 RepID=A0A1C3K4C1_9BURK|nr:hypothetical protein ODI_04134 [Orrella dioscoreae]SOE46516.1 hypothetical protein ODI_R0336 [Orrella dioscoreae]